MKKGKGVIIIAVFAIMIIGALFVARWYQLRTIARLQEEVHVIDSADIAKNLNKGTAPESRIYNLTAVGEDELVYQRGNSLYVGQGKEKVEGDFPFFTNEGNAVMLIKDDFVLIDTLFQEMSTFQGMYLSNGFCFNYDKSQADDETYLFLKLNNGLFMNAMPMTFSYPGGEDTIRMNSILYLGKDAARYYAVKSDYRLQYSELPTTMMVTVTINGETYSYEQLLQLLGIAGEGNTAKNNRPNSEKTPDKDREDFEEVDIRRPEELQAGAEVEEEGEREEDDKSASMEEQKKRQREELEKRKAEQEEKKKAAEEALKQNDAKNKDTSKNAGGAGNNSSGNGESGSSGGEGEEDKDTADVSDGDVEISDPDSADLSGNDVSGSDLSGNDVSGSDVSGNWPEPKFKIPTGELAPFETDVYSLSSGLTILDPSGAMRRVVLELYWLPKDENGDPIGNPNKEDDYQRMYRKTFRSAGDIFIDNLPPDTTIFCKGIMYYYDEDGKTESYEFYNGFEDRVKTLSLDYLDALYIDYDEDVPANEYTLPHQVRIFYMTASGKNPNVLNKVSKVQVTLKPETNIPEYKDAVYTFQINGSDFKNKYQYIEERGDRIVWESNFRQTMLPSNMKYNYEIKLLDSFGNTFTKILRGYMPEDEDTDWTEEKSLHLFEDEPGVSYISPAGSTRTCKVAPEVTLVQQRFTDGETDIDRARYEISIVDEDGATASHENEYYIQVFREDSETGKLEEEPTAFTTSRNDTNTITKLYLDSNNFNGERKASYEIWGLTAGFIYEVHVMGRYTLDNNLNEEANEDQLIGTHRFSTVNLSTYGRVSYGFSSEHVYTEFQPDGSIIEDENGNPVLSKYYSATAQKFSMAINAAQTNATLVELYMDRIELVMTEQTSGKEILKATLKKEEMEKVNLAGGGTEEIIEIPLSWDDLMKDVSSGLKDSYLPKIYLRTTDEAGTINLWDAFRGGAHFVFYWEEGSLNSYTGYQFDTTTIARQGGWDHDVSGRSMALRRGSFTTLKKMPYVTYDDILVVSDYIRIFNVNFHDDDQAILNGIVETALSGIQSANISLEGYGDGKTPDGGSIEEVRYNSLMKGRGYTVTFTPLTIRRDASGLNSLFRETLKSCPFVAGEGLSGELLFENISYPLENNGEEIDGVKRDPDRQYLLNDYSLYNASGYAVGNIQGNGTVPETEANVNNVNVWATSSFIPVTPGDVYYIEKPRTNPGDAATLSFYESNAGGNAQENVTINSHSWKKVDDSLRVGSNNGYRFNTFAYYDGAVVRVPEGVNYLRFTMYGQDPDTGIPRYATASIYALDKKDNNGNYEIKAADNVGTLEKWERPQPVKAGEKYAVAQGVNTYDYIFYSDEGGTTESETIRARSYFDSITVPAGAKAMKVVPVNKSTSATYTYTQAAESVLYKLNLEALEWLSTKDLDHFSNIVTVNVTDKLNNLVYDADKNNDSTVYYDIYDITNGDDEENRVLLAGEKDPLAASIREQLKITTTTSTTDGVEVKKTEDLNLRTSFIEESNHAFRIDLYVYYHGQKIELDSITFRTDRVLEAIHDRTELAKMMRYPSADFVVTSDITLRRNEWFYYSNDQVMFEGTVDFQGHSLTMPITSGQYGFRYIGSSGVVKNLRLRAFVDAMVNKAEITWIRGLCYVNYGTIQNIVLDVDLGLGTYRKSSSAFVCERNRGVIENFALTYSGASTNYVGNYFGGIAYDNSGIIRNGYAYVPSGSLSVTTGIYGGGEKTNWPVNNSYVGLIAATSGGTIENVYVYGNLSVERDKADSVLSSQSLISGNRGAIHGCFTIGELQLIRWETVNNLLAKVPYQYKTYGPAVNGNVAANTTDVSDVYYYTNYADAYNINVEGREERITDASLFQDYSFYNRTVNRDGAFELGDISAGYFPRVIMPEDTLMTAQSRIPLISVGVDNSVKFLYAEIKEQHEKGVDGAAEDYALATLVFRNRQEREINSVTIDGLEVKNPEDGPEVHNAVLTKENQKTNGAYYEVQVKLTPNGKYRSEYDVTEFKYSGLYTMSANKRKINVTFTKEVTQDNWLTAFDDTEGYYRLGGNIDFSKFNDRDQAAAAAVLSKNNMVFKGTLDGRNYKLSNFTFNREAPYLIYQLQGGTLKDIVVEDMTINASGGTSKSYCGLVGQCMTDSELNGIVMVRPRINGIYKYGGAITGSLTRSSMVNCVVYDFEADTDNEASQNLRVGGLAGSMTTTSKMENCYGRKLNLSVKVGQTADGVGGLTGYLEGNNTIRNCYAQGDINADFARVGGLVGYHNGIISACWSRVNLNTTTQYTGGIVGQADTSSSFSSLLSLGEIFTTASENYGRITGGFVSTARSMPRCYAAEEQKINGEVSTELLGASGFMTEEYLRKEAHYWDKINLGTEFDYSIVDKGYLPRLKYKGSSELLPLQETEGDWISSSLKGLDFEAEGEAELKEESVPGATEGETGRVFKTAEYELKMTLIFEEEELKDEASYNKNKTRYFGENFSYLSIENMKFATEENAQGKDIIKEPTPEFKDGKCLLTFTGLIPEKYVDSYRVIRNDGTNKDSAMLMFTDTSTGEKTPLYHGIYRVLESESVQKALQDKGEEPIDIYSWQGAMSVAGTSYENFMIMEDLDFTPINGTGDNKLRTMLRINRLEGNSRRIDLDKDIFDEQDRKGYLLAEKLEDTNTDTPEKDRAYKKISNLTFSETNTAAVNWIYELRTEMKYLNFDKIKWTNTPAGSYIGVIRLQAGTISYIDINDFYLNYGAATNFIGFITNYSGITNGGAYYLRGRNITVETDNANDARTVHHVGGIFAYTRGEVIHVGIRGTLPKPDDKDSTYGYRIQGSHIKSSNSGQYTGGIAGRMETIGGRFLYARDIQVRGNQYVGALVGSMADARSNQEINPVIELGALRTAEGSYYITQAVNCNVEGRLYIGGMYGSSGSRWGYSVGNTVHATESYAGGYTGANGGYYNNVLDCDIKADVSYAGGLAGGAGTTTYHYSRSVVRGCNISAGKYAGGMIPVVNATGSTTSFGTIVDCAITAEEYVGGACGNPQGDRLDNVLVKHCYIGRCDGEIPRVNRGKDAKGNTTYDLIWDTESDEAKGARGADYVGGLVGYGHGVGFLNAMVEDDVEVKGNAYVGGIMGAGGGGDNLAGSYGVKYVETGATVYVNNQYGGGYAGLLVGYEQSRTKTPVTFAITRMNGVIIAGKIEGSASFVGGLFGAYRPGVAPVDADTGEPIENAGFEEHINRENFSRIILALTEINGSHAGGYQPLLFGRIQTNDGLTTKYNFMPGEVLRDTTNNKDVETGIDYLRIYKDISINGASLSGNYIKIGGNNYGPDSTERNWIGKYTGYTVDKHYVTNAATGATNVNNNGQEIAPKNSDGSIAEGDKDPYFVTTEDMQKLEFWYGKKYYGGLEFRNLGETSTTTYFNTGSGIPNTFRNFCYDMDSRDDYIGKNYPTIFPYVTINGNSGKSRILSKWQDDMTDLVPYSDGVPLPGTASTISMLDLSNALNDVSEYSSNAGSINIEYPAIMAAAMMSFAEEDEETEESAGSAAVTSYMEDGGNAGEGEGTAKAGSAADAEGKNSNAVEKEEADESAGNEAGGTAVMSYMEDSGNAGEGEGTAKAGSTADAEGKNSNAVEKEKADESAGNEAGTKAKDAVENTGVNAGTAANGTAGKDISADNGGSKDDLGSSAAVGMAAGVRKLTAFAATKPTVMSYVEDGENAGEEEMAEAGSAAGTEAKDAVENTGVNAGTAANGTAGKDTSADNGGSKDDLGSSAAVGTAANGNSGSKSGVVETADSSEIIGLEGELRDVEEIALEEDTVAPLCYFELYDENGALICRENITQQVYTIPYDFSTMLTLKVYAGGESRTIPLAGELLRNSVMTWKDHCYYLKEDGIYRDNGIYKEETELENTVKVLDGKFLHLYQGKALAEDGTIYDVETGEAIDALVKETLFVPQEEVVPAYETEFAGETIRTYQSFTAAEDDEVISDYRLFARNNKLFGMDPELDEEDGQNIWNFIADYYSTSQGSAEYLSALTEEGVLVDYKTALNWPTDSATGKEILQNFQIMEVGDNLNADRSYIIMRYYNNTVAAFDYLTGTLLFLDESEQAPISFWDYLKLWFSGKKASLSLSGAYDSAQELVKDLVKNPLDDELLGLQLDGTETDKDGAEKENTTEMLINGTGKTSGENEITGTGEFGSKTENESGKEISASAGEGDTAVSGSGKESGKGDTAIGGSGEVSGEADTAIGGSGKESGKGDTAIGGSGEVSGKGDTAIEGSSKASGEADTAIGGSGEVSGKGDTAIGGSDKVSGESTMASGGTEASAGAAKETGAGIASEGKETGGTNTVRDTLNGEAFVDKNSTGMSVENDSDANETGGRTEKADTTTANVTTENAEAADAESNANGEAEKADATTANVTTENGEAADAESNTNIPALTSDRAYVTMVTADADGYEVFRASDLLRQRGSALLSENRKIELLEDKGLHRSSINLDAMKLTKEENSTGMLLIAVVSASMIILLAVLYLKKRKLSEKNG